MDFRTNINIDRLSLEIKHIFMAILSLIFGASEVFGGPNQVCEKRSCNFIWSALDSIVNSDIYRKHKRNIEIGCC